MKDAFAYFEKQFMLFLILILNLIFSVNLVADNDALFSNEELNQQQEVLVEKKSFALDDAKIMDLLAKPGSLDQVNQIKKGLSDAIKWMNEVNLSSFDSNFETRALEILKQEELVNKEFMDANNKPTTALKEIDLCIDTINQAVADIYTAFKSPSITALAKSLKKVDIVQIVKNINQKVNEDSRAVLMKVYVEQASESKKDALKGILASHILNFENRTKVENKLLLLGEFLRLVCSEQK